MIFGARTTRVQGVSWPRSGHHVLARLLGLYFGPKLRYCAFYDMTECCGQTPCARDGLRYVKNHDFDGSLAQCKGRSYLIQTRAFTPSVVSNYELALRDGRVDTAQGFAEFASAGFTAYRAFQAKWVLSDFAKHQTVLRYEQLVQNPLNALAHALTAFGETDPSETRMREAIARVDGETVAERKITPRPGTGVHAPRDVTQFRHYDPALFAKLDKLTLTRQEVSTVFRRILGRDPAEANMLALQTTASVDALTQMVLGSPEYATRAASAHVV